MKIKNYILAASMAGVSVLPSCKDYMEPEALSSYPVDFVFSYEQEVESALNGVYAQALSNNTYGDKYLNTFCLNSDVEVSFKSSNTESDNQYRRFDCTSDGGDIKSFWNQMYASIEYANSFIYNLEHSAIYDSTSVAQLQMIGEAKVLRAMFYHDLVTYFGDVPFSFEPSQVKSDFVLDVMDRTALLSELIEDLKVASKNMQFASNLQDGVERASKEFAWAMISRIAMTAGGYSLRPDGSTYGKMERPENYLDFYQTAQAYADSVIESGKHTLALPYRTVFMNECNYVVVNNDDPIFELPFARNAAGNIGYIYGPKCASNDGTTSGPQKWGATDGSVLLSHFYRLTFAPEDVRKDYVLGYWDYDYKGKPVVLNTYGLRCNKWSKLWSQSSMGAQSTGNTGINFPYMRYADVLLMYAEATCELEGATSKALDCVRQVHMRATDNNAAATEAFISSISGDKETFLKGILDERKWEFAGENMRWKDLVRNNVYNKELYWEFRRYWARAAVRGGDDSEAQDVADNHDGVNYCSMLPQDMYYHIVQNPLDEAIYPNKTLDILQFVSANVVDKKATINLSYVYPFINTAASYAKHDIFLTAENKDELRNLLSWTGKVVGNDSVFTCKYHGDSDDDASSSCIKLSGTFIHAGGDEGMFQWTPKDDSDPRNELRYWLFGFIRCTEGVTDDINPQIVENGVRKPLPSDDAELPVVRYILPYPTYAIQHSRGKYENKYGYVK